MRNGKHVPDEALENSTVRKGSGTVLHLVHAPTKEDLDKRVQELLRDCATMSHNIMVARKRLDGLMERMLPEHTRAAISVAEGLEDVCHVATMVHWQCRHFCLDVMEIRSGREART